MHALVAQKTATIFFPSLFFKFLELRFHFLPEPRVLCFQVADASFAATDTMQSLGLHVGDHVLVTAVEVPRRQVAIPTGLLRAAERVMPVDSE